MRTKSRKRLYFIGRIVLPSQAPDDWKRSPAQRDFHWKTGYSARTLAHSWEAAKMTPSEVAPMMSEAFALTDLLMAVPEHKTVLPGGGAKVG